MVVIRTSWHKSCKSKWWCPDCMGQQKSDPTLGPDYAQGGRNSELRLVWLGGPRLQRPAARRCKLGRWRCRMARSCELPGRFIRLVWEGRQVFVDRVALLGWLVGPCLQWPAARRCKLGRWRCRRGRSCELPVASYAGLLDGAKGFFRASLLQAYRGATIQRSGGCGLPRHFGAQLWWEAP